MKIVLIRAPFINTRSGPPVGLAYLSTELKNAGHEIHIIDFNVELNKKYPDSIAYNRDFEIDSHNDVYHFAYGEMDNYCTRILDMNPDLVGFHLSYPTFRYSKEMALRLCKHVRCIAGGPCASYNEKELLELNIFDTVVSGYGEEGILAAITNKGIITEPLIASKKYVPDYSQMDLSDYNGILPVITTRGCPNNCNFCTQNHTYYYHDIESVVDQIESIKDVKMVMFNDSNLNVNSNRTKMLFEALSGISNKPYGHIFGLQIKSDYGMYVNLMAKSGVKEVRIGIESGSIRERNSMNKPNVSNELIVAFVKELTDNNINVMAQYIFCYPDQTEQDRSLTRKLINDINHNANPSYVNHFLYKFVVHHGTEKYFADKHGVNSTSPQNWTNILYNPEAIRDLAEKYQQELPENCKILL